MQSVLNALKDMDFMTVLAAVLADAGRLQRGGMAGRSARTMGWRYR